MYLIRDPSVSHITDRPMVLGLLETGAQRIMVWKRCFRYMSIFSICSLAWLFEGRRSLLFHYDSAFKQIILSSTTSLSVSACLMHPVEIPPAIYQLSLGDSIDVDGLKIMHQWNSQRLSRSLAFEDLTEATQQFLTRLRHSMEV